MNPNKTRLHNAKRCPFAKRQQIVNALANGDSQRAISRTLQVSNNTVTAVAEQEWQQVEARKARIAAQCERNATLAADQLTERLETEKLSANQLVPILGVNVDKMLALRGGAALTLRHEHTHRITDDDLLAFAIARSKQIQAAQGQVIEGEIVQETSLLAENTRSKKGS